MSNNSRYRAVTRAALFTSSLIACAAQAGPTLPGESAVPGSATHASAGTPGANGNRPGGFGLALLLRGFDGFTRRHRGAHHAPGPPGREDNGNPGSRGQVVISPFDAAAGT